MQQILGLREPCFRLAEHRHEESKSNYKELFVFQGMPEGGQVSGPVLKLAMTSEIEEFITNMRWYDMGVQPFAERFRERMTNFPFPSL